MKVKGPFPPAGFEGSSLTPLLEAYLEVNQLKHLYRQGWLRRGVPPENCESVADHIYGMVMLAWWSADQYFPTLNRDLVIRLVLAHELGEIYTGDLIPADGITLAEKHQLERHAVERVVGKLPHGSEYLDLWEEYESQQTPEARFVKQIDRLEMAFQASVYESQHWDDMSEFFQSAQQALSDPLLQDIFQELQSLRQIRSNNQDVT